MSWDKTWEEIFRSKEWGKYPSEGLVRFIARSYYKVPQRNDIKFLDLGCGTGANAWFLAREGFDVYAIDGSKTAIKIAKERFQNENLKAEFKAGDFIKLDYPNGFFDCVIDIAALQHNKPEYIKIVLDEVYRVLKPGGKLFSIMNSQKSKISKDVNLFSNKRFVYFFNGREIKSLFVKFNDLIIDEVTRTDKINSNILSHFIVQGAK